MFGLEDPYLIIVNVSIIVFCTLMAGMMSGLNLAFFSLDLTAVSSIAMGVNEVQAKRAKRILIVLQHPHWLLVTLLLCNAIAGESLPLALDDMIGPEVAIPVSVLVVLFFGEIIPQSVFVSNAIAVCSFFSYIIYAIMILTAPITLLIGIALDKLVGHREAMFYRRRELREFLSLQAQPFLEQGQPDWTDSDDEAGGVLDQREIKLMMGALSLSETTVKSCMRTRMDEALCLDMNAKVTKELVEMVFLRGKSRIPVFVGSPDNCTHYFLSKTLVLQTYKKEEDAPYVKDLALIPARFIDEDQLMGDAYKILTAQPVHMLFVRGSGSTKTIGLMTTADVLETIHSARFVDEYDLANPKSMQMLIKSCWTEKSREVRSSQRRSRAGLPRSGSYHHITRSGANRSVSPSPLRDDSLPPSISSNKSAANKTSHAVVHLKPQESLVAESVNRNSYGTNTL